MAEMTYEEARTNVQRLRDGADGILDESIWICLVYADAWAAFIDEYGEDWEWEDEEDDSASAP